MFSVFKMKDIQILNTRTGVCHSISTKIPNSDIKKQIIVDKLNDLKITENDLKQFKFPVRFFRAYAFQSKIN